MPVRFGFPASRPSFSGPAGILFGNIASAFLLRGLNLVATLLIVPLAVRGLGAADYALLAMILSATVLFGFSDLGLGLAVVNPVSRRRADPVKAQAVVRRVFWTLTVLAAVMATGCAIWIGALQVLHGPSSAVALATALLLTALGLPFGVAQRLLFALQQGMTAGLWIGAGRLASLAGVVLAFHFQAGLLVYVLAIVGLPVLTGAMNAAWLFLLSQPDLSPFAGAGRIWPCRKEFVEGLAFLVLQVAAYVEFGADILLVGFFLGPDEVARYDLMARMFGYVPALIAIGAFPLWPALGQARERRDPQTRRRLLDAAYGLAAVLCAGLGLTLAAAHATMLKSWTGVAFPADYPLALGWSAFVVATGLATIQGMDLNAAGRIVGQARLMALSVCLVPPVKWLALTLGAPAALPLISAGFIVIRIALLGRGRRSDD